MGLRAHTRVVASLQRHEGVTDEGIVRQSLVDPEVFGVLFERHGDLVFRFAAAQTSRTIGEDITSETFITAFNTRSRYRGDAPPRAWLLGIASNLLRRHWRSRGRLDGALSRINLAARVHNDARDLAPVEDSLSDGVRLALESMSPPLREVLLLRAWGDLSYEEIGAVLGVRVGTVRSRISRARSAFESAMSTEGRGQP